MAVFYAKTKISEKMKEQLEVRGAGVMTVSSLLPAPETAIVMKEDDIDVTPHRSTKLTKELVKKSDLILGMTPFHVQMAKRISDLAKNKTFLFMEYVEDNPKQYQIADPMGGTLETFKITYKNIKKAIDKLIAMEEKGIYQKKSSLSKDGEASKTGAPKARKRGRPRKSESEKKATAEKAKKKKAKEKAAQKKSPVKKAAKKAVKKTSKKTTAKKKTTVKKTAAKKTVKKKSPTKKKTIKAKPRKKN
jgi:protein-tyrosine-phosphatase